MADDERRLGGDERRFAPVLRDEDERPVPEAAEAGNVTETERAERAEGAADAGDPGDSVKSDGAAETGGAGEGPVAAGHAEGREVSGTGVPGVPSDHRDTLPPTPEGVREAERGDDTGDAGWSARPGRPRPSDR